MESDNKHMKTHAETQSRTDRKIVLYGTTLHLTAFKIIIMLQMLGSIGTFTILG